MTRIMHHFFPDDTINLRTELIDWFYDSCDQSRRDEWSGLLYKVLFWSLLATWILFPEFSYQLGLHVQAAVQADDPESFITLVLAYWVIVLNPRRKAARAAREGK